MTPLPTFSTAQAAFVSAVTRVIHFGNYVQAVKDRTSVGSQFGRTERATRELVADGFIISNPRDRIIHSSGRPLNLPFAVANVIWTLAGSNDLEMIAFYNPRGRLFSDDGCTLAGAVGHRLFASPAGNQVAAVLDRLKSDFTSRRSVLQVLSPSDMVNPPLDTPCSIAFEFLLREGRLSAITFMRSQSVVGVLPYDLFLFTCLQESLAVALKVDVGPYHHISGSLHYYDDEAETAARVSSEIIDFEHGPMPRMTSAAIGPGNDVALAELDLRTQLQKDAAAAIDVDQYGLDSFWTQLLRVLVVGGRKALGADIPASELASLDQPYRGLLTRA